jgi:ketosteroid isomerase-like protein
VSGEMVMRRVAAAFEKADLRPLFDAIDDDIVWKSAAGEGGPFAFGGVYRNRAGVLEVTSHIAARYAFSRFSPREIVSSGDIVWGLFEVEGEYFAAAPGPRLGKPCRFDYALRWRLRRGRIVEHQGFFDTDALLRQQTA